MGVSHTPCPITLHLVLLRQDVLLNLAHLSDPPVSASHRAGDTDKQYLALFVNAGDANRGNLVFMPAW